MKTKLDKLAQREPFDRLTRNATFRVCLDSSTAEDVLIDLANAAYHLGRGGDDYYWVHVVDLHGKTHLFMFARCAVEKFGWPTK